MKRILMIFMVILFLTSCSTENNVLEEHLNYYEGTGYSIEYPFYRSSSFVAEPEQLKVDVDFDNQIVRYNGIKDISYISDEKLSDFYYYNFENNSFWNKEISNYTVSIPIDEFDIEKLYFPFEIEQLEEFSITETDNVREYHKKGVYSSFNFNTKYFDNLQLDHIGIDTFSLISYDYQLQDLEVDITVKYDMEKKCFNEIKLDFTTFYKQQTEDNKVFDSVEESVLIYKFTNLEEDIELPSDIKTDDYFNTRQAEASLYTVFDSTQIIDGVINYRLDNDFFLVTVQESGTYSINTTSTTESAIVIWSVGSCSRFTNTRVCDLEPGDYYVSISSPSYMDEPIQYTFSLELIPE